MKALDEIHSRLAQEDIDSLLQEPRFTDNHFVRHSLSNEFEDTSERLTRQEDMKVVPKSKKTVKLRKATTIRKNYRGVLKSRIEKALLKMPVMPPPSRETMLEMLHDIRYLKLIPYFKKEVGQARTDTGVKKNLLKALDPKAYEKFRIRASEIDKLYRRRRTLGLAEEKVMKMELDVSEEGQDHFHGKGDSSSSDKKWGKKAIAEDKDLYKSSEESDSKVELKESPRFNHRPSKQEMLRIFRSGGYTQLIPYFRKQVSGFKSRSGIRQTIMKHVDPKAYTEVKEKQRQMDAKRRSRQP